MASWHIDFMCTAPHSKSCNARNQLLQDARDGARMAKRTQIQTSHMDRKTHGDMLRHACKTHDLAQKPCAKSISIPVHKYDQASIKQSPQPPWGTTFRCNSPRNLTGSDRTILPGNCQSSHYSNIDPMMERVVLVAKDPEERE